MPGINAQGVQLKAGDGGSPEVFTIVGYMTNFEEALTANEIDVTAHDSPGGVSEYIGGKIDVEFTVELNYVPARTDHRQLRNDLVNRTARHYQAVYPDGSNTTDSWTGIVTEFTGSWPGNGEDPATAELTMRSQGLPVFG